MPLDQKKHAFAAEERQLLAAVGEALYGPPWPARVAAEIGQPHAMLSMMQHGRRPVSGRVWGPLAELAERRGSLFSALAVRADPGPDSAKHACLENLGQMLYGTRWKAPMAADLMERLPELFRNEDMRRKGEGLVGKPDRKLAAYARGDRPVPGEFWGALRQVAARRVVQLRRLLPRVLEKAQDVEG